MSDPVDPVDLDGTDGDEPEAPCFFDAPFTEVDSRFIVSRSDWDDYIHDLDRIKRADHRYAEPEEFPFYVATAFLGREWVHQTVGLASLRRILESLRLGHGDLRADTAAQFGQPVRRWVSSRLVTIDEL